MPSAVTIHRPGGRVVISPPRSSVSVIHPSTVGVAVRPHAPGIGSRRFPALRVTLHANPAKVVTRANPAVSVGVSKQGPRGVKGDPGTGVEHLEPRIAALEDSAVLTGILNW